MEHDATTGVLPETSPGLRRLDPRVVILWRVAGCVYALVASLGIGTATFFGLGLGWVLPIAGATFVLAVSLALILPSVRYRHCGYQLRQSDLVVHKGALWRTVSLIPHARIQHVDTRTGPLERWLGLARVVVYTAGTIGAQTTLPGLAVEDAEALRDRLAALGGGEDAV